MKPALALCLAFSVAAFPGAAWAGDHTHTVAAGETLESIAKQYYGSSWKSVYIAAKNGLEDGKPVPSGKRLAIPSCFVYRVRKGDSVGNIAKRYLGDDDRYKAVMQENGLKDAAELQVGQELVMPFVVRHTVQNGENLSALARQYYRTTRKAGLIKDYNKVDEVKAGDRVTVPIFDRAALDVKDRARSGATPAPASPEAAAPAPAADAEEPPRASETKSITDRRADLRRAVDGWRAGEFESACKSLEQLLDVRGFEAQERSLIVSHLGFCAVAAGQRGAATDYFTKWLELDPKAQLDPITTSPKILEVFYDVREKRGEAP